MVTEQGINVPAGEQASTSHAVAEAAAEPASQVLAPEFPPVPDAISAENLRAEFAEIVAVASQASRLGVAVDVADALRKGISADVLRRSVLDELAARAEATSVIAVAPPQPTAGDSPIVRRARERAASASR